MQRLFMKSGILEEESNYCFSTRDEFQRKKIAENLITLLTSDAEVSPLIIDGNWGTGKTEFTLKLIKLLQQEPSSFKAIYINAYREDHANNPLMTLLTSIAKVITEDEKNSLLHNAKPAIRFALKTTLKAGAGWFLKQDGADLVDGFSSEIKNAADTTIDYMTESFIKDHEKSQQSLIALTDSMKEIAENTPLILFIDELDRCRPNFAIDLLEVIKHIFSVPKVQFVLVTNTEQLSASIKHCYGKSIDSFRYLDKFIGFRFKLPDFFSDKNASISASLVHLDNEINMSNALKDSLLQSNNTPRTLSLLSLLVKENNLSLREVETLVRYIGIYNSLSNNLNQTNGSGKLLLQLLGVYIYCFKPDITNELILEKVSSGKIIALLGMNNLPGTTQLHEHYEDKYAIAATLAYESTEDEDLFDFSSNVKSYWDERIKAFFKVHIPIAGGGSEILLNAVKTLMLTGN